MTPFEELQRIANESGVGPALDYLEQSVRREKNHPALFEVLKMKVRHGMGLPLLYSQLPDELSESQQRTLEDGLLAACREVGTLLMRAGDIQQGWMFLQPVGDRALNLKLLQAIEPDEENIDLIIDTAVTQGAAPAYGYQLLLKHYGTCNGITTFETQSGAFDRSTQKEMAVVLTNHLYDELMGNIRYAFSSSQSESEIEKPFPDEISLGEVMADYPSLTEHGAHHIDTTHLASLMRIARLIEDPKCLKRVYELALYGSRLSEDFHYAGHPPFENTYADHLQYFGAIIGAPEVDPEKAIQHFREKIESVNVEQFGPIAAETTVELLYRMGRNSDALELMLEKLWGQHAPMGVAPDPMTIANTEPLRERLVAHYREHNDLVSYAAGILGSLQS